MAELFQATKQNISLHIRNIYKEGELKEGATVKEYLTVQKEGKRNVQRHIFNGQISKQLRQDVDKHNESYPGVTLHKYTKAYDRFLIIDEEVYHIGASLKDLGKKLFAFSRMEVLTGSELLARL